MFIKSLHVLTIPFDPSSLPTLVLVVPSYSHELEESLTTLEYVVRGLYTTRYLIALPPRVQLMEQLVLSAKQ